MIFRKCIWDFFKEIRDIFEEIRIVASQKFPFYFSTPKIRPCSRINEMQREKKLSEINFHLLHSLIVAD